MSADTALKDAITLFDAGCRREAIGLLAQALAAEPGHLRARLVYATLLAKSGDSAAEDEFRRALAIAPDSLEAHYSLGLLCQARGAADTAAEHYHRVLAQNPEHVQSRSNLGALLLDRGETEAALDCLRQATAQAPGYLGAQFNLGNACLAAGQFREAEGAFRAALALKPDFARAHNNLGVALQKQKRQEEAEAAFRTCLHHDPKEADALRNLANILNGRDELAAAKMHYQAAIALKPEDAEAQLGLAEAMIKEGSGAAALEGLDRVLALRPGDTKTLSLKCAALAVAGAPGEESKLADHERLLRRWRIEDLGSFDSLAALNKDLADHVANHPSLREDVTTKHGLDTDEILTAQVPAVQTLRRFIEGSVQRFMGDIGVAADHPFLPARPTRYRFKCWGVRMWRQGYQVPHIHHNAWLSGVYYVRLPQSVSEESGGQEGWIEFGRGEDKLYRHADPQINRIKPEEGLMLTFPSYFWHRTLPFSGDEDRISIAFDVIPEN